MSSTTFHDTATGNPDGDPIDALENEIALEVDIDFEGDADVEIDDIDFEASDDSDLDDSDSASDDAASDDGVPFAALGLPAALTDLLARNGVHNAFPVQAATIPDALAGRHVLGKARTGSGKTLAFGLPMLANIQGKRARKGKPLGLILVPTRELAMQVSEALRPYGFAIGVDIAAVFGGAPMYKQVYSLRRGVEVLVATPGRLTDLIEQEECDLSEVEIAVLDEADQMADMGFLPIVSELLGQTDQTGQRLLFSATLDGAVDELVKKFMTDPVLHSVASDEGEPIKMDHHLLVVEPHDKSMITAEIAARHTPGTDDAKRTILFARTKLGADRIAEKIREAGVQALALHGGMTQAARTKTLADFKNGRVPVLVATDVAARGIHVDGIDLVLHVDPANDAKDYLHRAGRTARAGEAGTVVTLVLPKQRKATLRLLEQAGVEAELTKVAPSSDELRELTGGRPVAEYAAEAEAWRATRRTERETRGGGYDRDSRGGGRGGFDRGDRGDRGGFGSADNRHSGGERRSFGNRDDRPARPSFGDRDNRGGTGRPSFNRDDRPARPSFGDRDNRGARPSFGDRDNRGAGGGAGGGSWREPRERRTFEERPGTENRGGERRSFGDRDNRGGAGRPSFNRDDRPARPSFGDRDNRGGGFNRDDRPARPSFGDRDNRGGGFNRDDRGARPAHGDRGGFGGERRSFGDRDNRGGAGRPSFNRDDRGGAPRGDRPGFENRGGERRSFGDRDNRGGGFNRDDRGGRPSYGDRDNRGGGFNRDDRGARPSYGDRDNRGGTGRPSFNRDDRGGRPSYGDRDNSGGDRNDRGPGTFSRNGGERKGFGGGGNRDSRPPRDRRF